MEHKFYTDDFERLLKEKSDEFRMYPSKRVWHSIYNNLHPDRKWPSITVSLILVTVLFLIGYWNNSSNTTVNNTIAQQYNATASNATAATKNSSSITVPHGNVNSNNIDAVVKKSGTAAAISYPSNQPGTQLVFYKTEVLRTNKNSIVNAVVSKNELRVIKQTPVKDFTEKYTQLHVTTATAAIALHPTDAEIENIKAISNLAKPQTAFNNNNATVPTEENGNKAFIEMENTSEKNNISSTLANTSETLTQTGVKEFAASTSKKQLSAQDKSWIEHYAMYNKTTRKKWKGRLSSEVYLTPGVTIRNLYSNTAVKFSATTTAVNMPGAVTEMPAYNPGLSFQTGAGLTYATSKNIRLKAGIQASFTSYTIPVTDINHPVLTTLTLNNPVSGYPYLEARASTIANVPGHNNKKIHNQTSQVSIPLGVALKLGGNDKLQWYAGASVQPTYILGGKAYLISSDNNNYVTDASMLRKWNMNGAAETYIQYKMSGFTLQAGPEVRYQFMSTYSTKYSNTEKLYNVGIKVGIVKSL